MNEPRRPGPLPVLLLALFASAMVWSFAAGHLNAQYANLWGCFLTMELWAVVLRVPGASQSERWWAWAGIRPQRPSRWLRVPASAPFFIVFAAHMILGDGHVWSGGYAVLGTSAPLAIVIGYSLIFDGRPNRGTP
jgi:hypothetical protein